MDYAAVGQALSRFGKKPPRNPDLRRQLSPLEEKIVKC
jgi:uncharacterized protein (DUF924 family)